MRVRTVKRHQGFKTSEKTLLKVLGNSEKQVQLYTKQLEFLEKRANDGDQIDQIQELQELAFQKHQELESKKKELANAGKMFKKSERTLASSLNEKGHKERVSPLI